MNRRDGPIALISVAVLTFWSAAFGQESGGTADEARAMLAKAVAAVKADEANALDMFNKGRRWAPGSRSLCDLHTLAYISDNKFVAVGNPNAQYFTCAGPTP